MNILLTSNWIKWKVRDFFIDEIKNKFAQRVCFLFTIRTEDDWKWLESYREEFRMLWLEYDEINISEDKDFSHLDMYDIYYVWWWNTFYILDRLRKTWLFKLLTSQIDKGKLYIWLSAWSMICAKDIEIAWWWINADENNLQLQDLTWFNKISFHPFVHYHDWLIADKESFLEYRTGERIETIKDWEAIFVTSNQIKLIK